MDITATIVTVRRTANNFPSLPSHIHRISPTELGLTGLLDSSLCLCMITICIGYQTWSKLCPNLVITPGQGRVELRTLSKY